MDTPMVIGAVQLNCTSGRFNFKFRKSNSNEHRAILFLIKNLNTPTHPLNKRINKTLNLLRHANQDRLTFQCFGFKSQ